MKRAPTWRAIAADITPIGPARVDHRTKALTVVLKDLKGTSLYTKTLEPAQG